MAPTSRPPSAPPSAATLSPARPPFRPARSHTRALTALRRAANPSFPRAPSSSGSCDAVIAGDTAGNVYFPAPENAATAGFMLRGDPYKGIVVKEDGSEVEEDVYEAYNMSLLLSGQKGSVPPGHGIRINGEKMMHTSTLKGNTYKAKIGEDSHNVTIDEVYVLKKGKVAMMLGVKGQYFFIGRMDPEKPEQTAARCCEGLAIGF
jgi:hypothetical protein